MPPARKPAKSRSKKARARRSPVPWPPRLPIFEQRHLDLIGLGLVAVGVFLAFPLYAGWEGGEAGQAIVDGLTWAVGRVAWATPVALVAAGALLVMRPALPAGVRPFRAGALCLLAASCLGLAVGTLGFGPGDGAPVAQRGGHLGQVMADASTRLFSDVGAHILAIFLFCAALLLLTGATIAGVLRVTGEQVVETARTLRPPPRSRAEPEPGYDPDATQPLLPPDLEDEEVVIRPDEDRGARRRPALSRPLRGRRRPAGARGGGAGRGARHRARARAAPGASRGRAPTTRTRTSRRSSTSTPATSSSACPTPASSSARAPSRSSPTPRARRRPPRGSSRRSATSACRRRSSAPSPARTSRATSCSSRPA